MLHLGGLLKVPKKETISLIAMQSNKFSSLWHWLN